MTADGAPSLRIQTVLYGNDRAAVEWACINIANSCRLAKQHGQLSEATLRVGDGSTLPILSSPDVEQLTERLVGHGLDGIDYDFFDANLGSAGGHNRLLDSFDKDRLLIVNPDVIADPAMVGELLLPFSEPLVGVVEAKQLPIEHPKPYNPQTGETPWVTTACAMARREVFEQVGGFDAESFFLYCDDVDWSWRVRLAGYRLIFQPAAKVFHDKQIDAEGNLVFGDAMIYYSAEAALFMFHKYSRPDLLEHYLAGFEAGAEARPLEAKAAKVFLSRRAAGTLPTPIDPEHRVASFIDGHYAQHRF